MKQLRIWQDGDKLTFKHPVTGAITYGKMRGYATIDDIFVGRGIIVELEDGFYHNGGKFNHMIVMEYWILMPKC